MEIQAFAKLNLTLDVLGKRPDGYHDLRMVMQSITLCDTLTLTSNQGQGLRVSTDLHFLPTGEKNLISQRLIELRRQHNMSQRLLAYQLQLNGYDMDKNVITRIETNKRYVTDVELKALTEIFNVSYEYLIEGTEEKS